MKIAFNLLSTGLGNNGGSLTIIKSVNTLTDMGYETIVVDSFKNKNTWVRLNTDHIIINDVDKFPKVDVVISTGFKSFLHNNRIREKTHAKIFSWIRGWETWNFTERDIIKKILPNTYNILVNSIWLKEKLTSLGYESNIVYPGNDLDVYKNENIREKNKNIIIGGLYHSKHRVIKRIDWIIDVVKKLRNKFKIELWMIGSCLLNESDSIYVNKYLRNPTENEKKLFYNQIDIWLAPTKQEGLHICPQEAMLCGCLVIGTSAPMSGMQDYLINNVTGLVSGNEFDSFCNLTEYAIVDKEMRLNLSRKGMEKIIEIGDRKTNMKKMIEIVEKC